MAPNLNTPDATHLLLLQNELKAGKKLEICFTGRSKKEIVTLVDFLWIGEALHWSEHDREMVKRDKCEFASYCRGFIVNYCERRLDVAWRDLREATPL